MTGALSIRNVGKVYDPDGARVIALDDVSLEIAAGELCVVVGLAGIEAQAPAELSVGMKRRVEIIRALINDPTVLLLDEPFRALDALTKSVMHEALLELYDLSRKTIFFITHDLEEAIFLAD